MNPLHIPRAAWILGTVLFLAAAGCPPPPDRSTLVDKWSLWLKGTQLRGANVWQRTVLPEVYGAGTLGLGPVGPPYTQADFDRLAQFGANYVNISHPGLYSVTPPYVLDEGIQANLDSLLAMINKADMFAVISFRTGPGRSEFTFVWDEDTTTDPQNGWFDASYYNDTVWTNQDAQDGWVAMWRYTAQRYKNSAVVVGYDLMVESNVEEVLFDIWKEPGEFYPAQAGKIHDWNMFYPKIVTAIRSVDATTPILVQPAGYGAVDWLPYLTKSSASRIVYAVHQYLPECYTHQTTTANLSYPGTFDTNFDGIGETVDRAFFDTLLKTIDTYKTSSSMAFAVNEFGSVRYAPNADTYMDDLIGLFESRGMNHALWDWGTSWPGYINNDDFSFRHGADPSNHADVSGSALITILTKYWQRNTVRPSNVPFSSSGGT